MAKQKQLAKKQARKARAKKEKQQKRRTALVQKKKIERNFRRAEHKIRERLVPYVKPETIEAVEGMEEVRIKKQLEHNMQILQALEEEYVNEMEAKKELNEALEKEGHMTLKEKLDALEITTKDVLKAHPEIEAQTGEEEYGNEELLAGESESGGEAPGS